MSVIIELALCLVVLTAMLGPVGVLIFIGICALYYGAQLLFSDNRHLDRDQKGESRKK